MSPVLTIVVANLKGGSTKTTTAAFVMHALSVSGLSVLGVDADGENESMEKLSRPVDRVFQATSVPAC